MKSPFKYRYGAFAAAVGAAALAVSMGVPSAGAATSDTIYYNVHPVAQMAFPSTGKLPGAFPTPSQCVASAGLACYTPQLLRSAYDIPASDTGAGQTVVIIDAYGSPTIRQDLATYDAQFGLPDANLNIFYPGGKPTYNPQQHHQEASWAQETSLDVEQVHGLAPGATIDLVVAANNAGDVLNNAEKFAVDNHLGNVMSMSFGNPEQVINGNRAQQNQAEAIYSQAVSQGMSVFASAGDNGASNGTSVAAASFPASDPLVTSVGGTNLFMSDTGTYQSETVWDDQTGCPFTCAAGIFGATGGGPSTLFGTPSYQSGVTGLSSRGVADVSFNASVYTATMIYLGIPGIPAGFYFFGGTSEGSPSWAAITALADAAIGHPLGELNPLLYKIYGSSAYASDFHDVTSGNNALNGPGFSAGKGYDFPTGIGSPDVANLISSLAAGQ